MKTPVEVPSDDAALDLTPADADRDVRMILGMLVTLAIPAIFTLSRVRAAPGGTDPNPTPLGYTVSLSLFIVPVLVITAWHVLAPPHKGAPKALLGSALTVTLLGTVLDFIFGYSFFTFPNQKATLGVRWPAWSWGQMEWIHDFIPVEEFLFYILGGLFMITSYLWADEHWLRDRGRRERAERARGMGRLLQLSPWTLVLCAALIGIAIVVKRYTNPDHPGLPGYFIFLTLLAFLPTFVVFKGVRAFINWRAFAFSYAALLLISLVWEATLGVPYAWWCYRPEQMMGIHIIAWGNLPVEAVLLWLVAAWGSVLSYEFYRVYFHMDRPPAKALLGIERRRASKSETE